MRPGINGHNAVKGYAWDNLPSTRDLAYQNDDSFGYFILLMNLAFDGVSISRAMLPRQIGTLSKDPAIIPAAPGPNPAPKDPSPFPKAQAPGPRPITVRDPIVFSPLLPAPPLLGDILEAEVASPTIGLVRRAADMVDDVLDLAPDIEQGKSTAFAEILVDASKGMVSKVARGFSVMKKSEDERNIELERRKAEAECLNRTMGLRKGACRVFIA